MRYDKFVVADTTVCWVPVPVVFALVDSAFSCYVCSHEKSATNHKEDGSAAIAENEPPEIMGASAFYYRLHGVKRLADRKGWC